MHLCTCARTMLWLWFVSVSHSCLGEKRPLRAYSPGDIIIGGLFPLHAATNRSTTPGLLACTDFDVSVFLITQVMIYAIDRINQRTPRLLPNHTLGYDIYDTCGDVSVAMIAALRLLGNHSDPESCLLHESSPSALPEPTTKAVIGERYSQVSIAVARVAALSSLAQISYSSTSEALSNKLKFPTFLRTISSDEYQTKAITELAERFNWRTVAIIGSDDEYGKYGSDRLEKLFRHIEICVEFITILPDDFCQTYNSSTQVSDLVKTINESFAEAIIMFTKETNAYIVMEAAVRSRLNRTWIASDSWATSTKVAAMTDIVLAGQVVGFIPKTHQVPGFKNYVMSNFNGTSNAFLDAYQLCTSKSEKNNEDSCALTISREACRNGGNGSCLVNYIDHKSYGTYLAVRVVLEGLRHLLKCDDKQCDRGNDFTAAELLKEIKNVNFTENNTRIFFDAHGDPSLGYDIVYWDMTKSNTDVIPVGEYWPPGDIQIQDRLLTEIQSGNVTIYNCSKTCKPGQQLKVQVMECCKHCVPCADGEYSPGNGTDCKLCDERHYSSPEKDKCLEKSEDFLQWFDPFSIILATFGGLGIIVTIVFTVLFTFYHRTPIVKAVGGKLVFLELISLLICFCLSFTFIGKPTEASCMAGLPFFGIAFSICISCILANLLQILAGFSFDPNIGSWFKKLNQPVAVVTIVSGIQLALCVPWLYYYPPFPEEEILSNIIMYECEKGSTPFFITMIGYNAFLALICLLFAFKGKKLPDLYKNAHLITISMLLFLIIWILFIQIYISKYGKYKLGIESGAILISSYSILCCHLAPKSYIMLFKKELNNEHAITEYIRKHYEHKGMAVVKS